ncbi:hypothetical protein IAT40_001591 [Kwoniella sp. CBS 6097]
MPRPGQAKYRRQRELAQAQAAAEASSSTSSTPKLNTHRYTFHHDPNEDEDDQYKYDDSYNNGVGNYDYQDGDYDGVEEEYDGGGGGGEGSGSAGGKKQKQQPRAQCLPIGELPLDFDGTPTDGSQYLAMVIKANDALPFVKSVDNPYKRPLSPSKPTKTTGNSAGGGAGAGPSRHPALPKESWEVLFPTHFRGYKKNVLSRLPPTSHLAYPADYPPLPNASHRSEWYAFVNGYITSKNKGKGKEKEKPKAPKLVPAPVMDEEEAMNAGPIPVQAQEAMVDPTADMEVDMEMDIEDEEGQEEKAEQEEVEQEVKGVLKKTSQGNERRIGEEREPLVSVLQRLNSTQAIVILSHFAYWLSELVNQLPSPIPDSPELLPTQPIDPDNPNPSQIQSSISSKPPRNRNVISSNYFNWIFSLLLILDNHLSSDQISILRDLARASMKVAGYRWVTAVVARDVSEGWVLGGNWKAARDSPGPAGDKSSLIGPQIPVSVSVEDTQAGAGGSDGATSRGTQEAVEKKQRQESVDDTLAKCWLIVHSIATGWGQRDLLEELETLFT